MRLKKDSSEQKLRGAYYTPLQLADAMVELFASQNISTVLEPSCGDGVFLDALQNLNLLNKVDKLLKSNLTKPIKFVIGILNLNKSKYAPKTFSTSIIVFSARNSTI